MHKIAIFIGAVTAFTIPVLVVIGFNAVPGDAGVAPQGPLVARQKASRKPGTLMYFYSPNCPHCTKDLKSTVSSFRSEGFTVKIINADVSPLANKYDIWFVPTFLYIEKGKEVRRLTGSQSERAIRKMLGGSSSWF